ncbi:hypothetical protein OMP40_19345 [Cohnella rhizosphaerae]|uniref:Uncharacterized protein n=1 Tax=Cohnella rhizosphaerae TaxID=1457232 RepID=A0A9X4KVP2_9BACL|nr:hypothetical protein [Cohnella rhizosphaerae]MDG0811283.1 hypothetical protein [Cohnella rhizosphaerae]
MMQVDVLYQSGQRRSLQIQHENAEQLVRRVIFDSRCGRDHLRAAIQRRFDQIVRQAQPDAVPAGPRRFPVIRRIDEFDRRIEVTVAGPVFVPAAIDQNEVSDIRGAERHIAEQRLQLEPVFAAPDLVLLVQHPFQGGIGNETERDGIHRIDLRRQIPVNLSQQLHRILLGVPEDRFLAFAVRECADDDDRNDAQTDQREQQLLPQPPIPPPQLRPPSAIEHSHLPPFRARSVPGTARLIRQALPYSVVVNMRPPWYAPYNPS